VPGRIGLANQVFVAILLRENAFEGVIEYLNRKADQVTGEQMLLRACMGDVLLLG
jgi:hypothetical protein